MLTGGFSIDPLPSARLEALRSAAGKNPGRLGDRDIILLPALLDFDLKKNNKKTNKKTHTDLLSLRERHHGVFGSTIVCLNDNGTTSTHNTLFLLKVPAI